ncbi:DUF3035 domain-containing protein [Sphingomonas sp. AAP5]|jgi:hypothetical protein|uniref:DUF3035 domain-containing protein n=1 Tax=Sphingomonas glacialis TaxID=658225 RepID=A0ABQ3LEP0_9SPHN|nr:MULTISPECIES: DUF3035 domain-containing protein [Sphingomonas]MDY7524928.1 DUF3035 domain-containing protein [Sphingomonas sp. 10B4]MEB0282126.1 DUF3035 domain-containing protein [Sphingomonas sp. 10B4]QBM74577.1 DUF3035 domain-containing protein [Sphingomonas sp. AAP5]GHH14057.1 hypothetical protein GCM10008023_15390 [Sphingomonas glacialis]
MRKISILSAGVALLALGACAHGKGGRSGPDEFSVARQAPLVIPPDFSLTPPKPGAARANDTSANAQALDALFGGTAPRSAAESAAISQAGVDSDDPGIRSSVGDPGTTVVDKGTTTRDVVAAPEGDGQAAKATAPK